MAGMACRRSTTLIQRQFIFSTGRKQLGRLVVDIKPKSTRFEFLGNRRERSSGARCRRRIDNAVFRLKFIRWLLSHKLQFIWSRFGSVNEETDTKKFIPSCGIMRFSLFRGYK